MLLQLWHAGVLTSLTLLLLKLLVVHSLLLLFLGHVATVCGLTRHTRLGLWHSGDVIGLVGGTVIDTVVIA